MLLLKGLCNVTESYEALGSDPDWHRTSRPHRHSTTIKKLYFQKLGNLRNVPTFYAHKRVTPPKPRNSVRSLYLCRYVHSLQRTIGPILIRCREASQTPGNPEARPYHQSDALMGDSRSARGASRPALNPTMLKLPLEIPLFFTHSSS